MSGIFISYNRNSEDVVKALAKDIEALGHRVWFDKELKGGQAWWDQILTTVRGCDVLVFVLDASTLSSTACKLEYGYATDLGKPILPVLVGEGVSTNLLPPALSKIQFVDYRRQDREAVLRLAGAIAAIPPAKSLPDPLPPPPDVPVSHLGRLAEQIEASPTLSYEQQSALVVDLKRSLRDPEIADDAHALLDRLRKRRDLLAAIAEEIDELSHVSAGSKSKPAGLQEKQRFNVQPSAAPTPHTPTPRKRKAAALVGGAVGSSVGVALLTSVEADSAEFLFALVPGLGGSIAGMISGTHPPKGLVMVCVGVALGWILAMFIASGNDSFAIGGIFGAPAGAILGAIAAHWLGAREASTRE